MAVRPPAPDWAPPEGYAWRVVEDSDWRFANAAEIQNRGCRRPRCPNPPVAALARTRRRLREPMDLDGTLVWWLYCADHLYGRWIEDGKVWIWVMRKAAR